jgi:hypothetical protein
LPSLHSIYDYETNDARENAWSYQGNRGAVGLHRTVSGYTVSVAASYYDQRYEDVLSGYPEKRHDGTQEYSVDLSRSVSKHVGLTLSEAYTIHDSNLPAFAYTRNIVGFFVVAHL